MESNNHTEVPPFFVQPLPNSTSVLVLGILSIALCPCYGFIGLIMGIIALTLSSQATKIYYQSKSQYTESSFLNMHAGKVCAIIGTCLSGLYLLFVIIAMILGFNSTKPWEMIK